ncbi:MAG: PIN domain-containing protein [Candidatus Tectomicrobia bacterium]|nr:PIN domain-containing protein [Candidatus Tectomicrobia bacterium]
MAVVLDASAMIAFLRNELGANVVESLLLDEGNPCMAHAINLCEVYYDFLRSANEDTARTAIADLESIGLMIREDIDSEFWQAAGAYKASIARVSLADCFAMALVQRIGAELVTSDHHEFDPIAQAGVCSVRFIR